MQLALQAFHKTFQSDIRQLKSDAFFMQRVEGQSKRDELTIVKNILGVQSSLV
jgi:hypothetical protein